MKTIAKILLFFALALLLGALGVACSALFARAGAPPAPDRVSVPSMLESVVEVSGVPGSDARRIRSGSAQRVALFADDDIVQARRLTRYLESYRAASLIVSRVPVSTDPQNLTIVVADALYGGVNREIVIQALAITEPEDHLYVVTWLRHGVLNLDIPQDAVLAQAVSFAHRRYGRGS